jgi:hypothetical protein
MANTGNVVLPVPEYIFHNKSFLFETLAGLEIANFVLNTAYTQLIGNSWTSRYSGAIPWVYAINATGTVPRYICGGSTNTRIEIGSGAANNDASGITAACPFLIRPAQSASMFSNDKKLIFEFYGCLDTVDNNGNTVGFLIGLLSANMMGASFPGSFEAKTSHQPRICFSSNNSADKKIVGVTADGAAETNTAAFDADFVNPHVYKIVYILGVSVEFFVDNVSIGVVNTTMPVSGVTNNPAFFFPTMTTKRISLTSLMYFFGAKCYFSSF